jgi:hypothetical protein
MGKEAETYYLGMCMEGLGKTIKGLHSCKSIF